LYRYDIAGSIAHACTLERAGVLTEREREAMVSSLRRIAADIARGRAKMRYDLEDVHMNVEHLLIDDLGMTTGGKLHTGRSRNDQVALDMRLMVREELARVMSQVLSLQKTLLGLAGAPDARDAILPGYTHMQHAQPVLLAHHLLAHFWRLRRDFERLTECYGRTNLSPLGSGALAGTMFPLDRTVASKMLRMRGCTDNSLDAVSDRDFCAESAFALSLLMIHLSSMCEELVLWSTSEFGFVTLPRTLSGGSSMMPQKRNPDIPELVRGKSGRTLGDLVAVLTLLKSLPLAYNRDLQEDKENLFDAFDTVGSSLRALTSFLDEVDFDGARMRTSAEVGLMTATDLADLLATKGMDFRTAHGAVREIADKSGGDDRVFCRLAYDLLRRHRLEGRGTTDQDFLSVEGAIDRRRTDGGTAATAVARQLEKAKATVKADNTWLEGLMQQVAAVDELLD